MVRFYILPNPEYLEEDEVDFELMMKREYDPEQNLNDRRRVLRAIFKEERSNPAPVFSGYNILDEIDILLQQIGDADRKLKTKFECKDVSRLRHFLRRLTAATANNDNEIKKRSEMCKLVENILRGHKQRVTYDPAELLSETDKESKHDEEAANKSWWNTDKNALVRVTTPQKEEKILETEMGEHSKHYYEKEVENTKGKTQESPSEQR